MEAGEQGSEDFFPEEAGGLTETVYVVFSAEIQQRPAELLLQTLSMCANEGATEVRLLLSTLGGNLTTGLNLYHLLRGMPFRLVTHNAGDVMSIGVPIYLAGDERLACPGSTFMVHGVTWTPAPQPQGAKWFKERHESVLADQGRIDEILVERTSLTAEELARIGESEITKDARTAVAEGIAHDIGGLYRALAERGDPIVLDEVIRHEHEVDREAARLIRAGEGEAALDLYRSAERVTVAPDAEARRQAMVADWHRSFSEGDDALMVAKRNAEVERLNATAREVLRAEGQLGEAEIEVAGARFAAGDQIITRVNDHANAIHNRERWQAAEVDVENRRLVLDGIDQARRVEVGPGYLDRTTPRGEAPAIQHGYAPPTAPRAPPSIAPT